MHIEVRVLGGNDIDLARQLIYEVYCLEQGYEFDGSFADQKIVEQNGVKMLTDKFDDQCVWVGAILHLDDNSTKLIGCTRMSKIGMPEIMEFSGHPKWMDKFRTNMQVTEQSRNVVHKNFRGNGALVLRMMYYVIYVEMIKLYKDSIIVGVSVNPINTKASMCLGACVMDTFSGGKRSEGKECDILFNSSSLRSSQFIWNTFNKNDIKYDPINNTMICPWLKSKI